MDNPIQVDLGRIAQDLQIRRVQVESVVQLLDEGNTVPFITRYRKERTGNLNEVAIREVQARVGRLRELAERKETILKAIEAQGKLSDELAAAIRAADNPKRLEDLYLPYKPKKKTKASEARDKGLEPLALRIWDRDETLTDLGAAAAEFLNPEKEVDSVEKVLEGVGHILAEAINELANVRDAVRRVVWKTGKVLTTKAENVPEGDGLEYRDYFAYSEPIGHIPPHRVLAINRGDKEGPLKVRLELPRAELERALFSQLPLEGHPQVDALGKAALDALDRLLLPSLEREVRRDLTDMAERHAVDVFARNLRSLLLQPPIAKLVVLAIDPGFRTGCKVAVLDPNGNLLEHTVIHPHPPQNRRHEAKMAVKELVGRHKVGVVAIGNGTACRETEELIAEIIAEGTEFHQKATEAGSQPAAAPEAEADAPTEPIEPIDQSVEPEAEAPTEPTDQEVEPEAEAPTEPTDQSVDPDGSSGANENGAPATAATEDPVEVLPPISGGAPEEGEGTETGAPGQPPAPESGEAAPLGAEFPQEAARDSADEPGTIPPSDDTTGAPPATETVQPDTESGAATVAAPDDGSPPVAAEADTPAEAIDPAAVTAQDGSALLVTGEPDETHAPRSEAEAHPIPEHDGVPAPTAGGKASRHSSGLTSPPAGPKPRQDKHETPRPPRPKQPPPPPAPHPADALLAQLAYVIVNEAGASVYSTSPNGREEFPDFDATLRGTISIGRRLQDPLAELVKIEPQNIGVGLYQHDVNPRQLKETLDAVIESCVNFVGVDLNTASIPLLRHVSGLNQLTARRLVEHRTEKGPFTAREQLQQVEGIGPITYTQAAGFLKIPEGDQVLDRTWVHPESYGIAGRVLEQLGFGPEVILHKEQLPALHAKMNEVDLPALARELEVGDPTLHDIFEALARPERDPREDLPKPIFKKGVLKLEDLTAGMELKGTVLNVVDFGAFVDIGLKDSGLVHISQLANRYIKSPHDVVSVGDVVSVWVMGVDQERKRVSLTMVQPGTERVRGGPGQGPGGGGGGGGGRRPQGEPRGGGRGERRPGGPPPARGPRREGSAPQPAGAEGNPSPGESPAGAPPRAPERPSGRGPSPGGPGGGGRYSGPPSRGPGGGPGRGGPRSYQGSGGGPGRPDRTPLPPRPPVKPAKPAPPPPPLSKAALTGSVPLRTFGQLKQLWQARTAEEIAADEAAGVPPMPPAATEGPDQDEPNADPQPISDQSEN